MPPFFEYPEVPDAASINTRTKLALHSFLCFDLPPSQRLDPSLSSDRDWSTQELLNKSLEHIRSKDNRLFQPMITKGGWDDPWQPTKELMGMVWELERWACKLGPQGGTDILSRLDIVGGCWLGARLMIGELCQKLSGLDETVFHHDLTMLICRFEKRREISMIMSPTFEQLVLLHIGSVERKTRIREASEYAGFAMLRFMYRPNAYTQDLPPPCLGEVWQHGYCDLLLIMWLNQGSTFSELSPLTMALVRGFRYVYQRDRTKPVLQLSTIELIKRRFSQYIARFKHLDDGVQRESIDPVSRLAIFEIFHHFLEAAVYNPHTGIPREYLEEIYNIGFIKSAAQVTIFFFSILNEIIFKMPHELWEGTLQILLPHSTFVVKFWRMLIRSEYLIKKSESPQSTDKYIPRGCMLALEASVFDAVGTWMLYLQPSEKAYIQDASDIIANIKEVVLNEPSIKNYYFEVIGRQIQRCLGLATKMVRQAKVLKVSSPIIGPYEDRPMKAVSSITYPPTPKTMAMAFEFWKPLAAEMMASIPSFLSKAEADYKAEARTQKDNRPPPLLCASGACLWPWSKDGLHKLKPCERCQNPKVAYCSVECQQSNRKRHISKCSPSRTRSGAQA